MHKEKFLASLNALSVDHKPALLMSAVTTVFIIIVCIILYSFFPQKIAQTRFQQIESLGTTTSIITSKLALSSMYRRNKTLLSEGLQELSNQISENNSGLVLISVILYPSGTYYASTSEAFVDKKIHPSLREKIENSVNQNITINTLNYQNKGKTIPVLQFLRNILVEREGEKIRIATTQILFDYSYIVEESKKLILLMGFIVFLISQFLIWFILLPRSYADVKMLRALRQARIGNFDIKFQPNQWGQSKNVVKAYYSLMRYLKNNPPISNPTADETHLASLKEATTTTERTFRKTLITTLCTRIPNIQEKIENNPESSVPDFLKDYLQSLDEVMKKNGGKVSNVFGDKVFVLFEGVNGTDNALRAAIQINNMWQKFNHEKKVLKQPQLTYGIGIHEAQSIAGTFIDLLSNYTYISESAGFASYLCDCAKNEEILTSEVIVEKTNLSVKQKRVTNSKAYWLLNGEDIYSLVEKDIVEIQLDSKKPTKQKINKNHKLQPPNYNNISIDHQNGSISTNTSSHFEQDSDLSIPNMLEETLSQAPLETVNDNKQKNDLLNEQNGDSKEQISEKKNQDTLNKDSMWDQFKTSKTS